MAASQFEQDILALRKLGSDQQEQFDRRSLELRSAIAGRNYSRFDELVQGTSGDDADPDRPEPAAEQPAS